MCVISYIWIIKIAEMEEYSHKNEEFDLNDFVIDLDNEQIELINEINSLEDELKNLNGKKLENSLFDSIKEVAFKSIDAVFEISDFLESNPEQGARITTLHNFEKGITANDEDKAKYDRYNDKTYNRDTYQKGFKSISKELSDESSEYFTDCYTGKRMERGDDVDWDHITSTKEFDKSVERNLYFNDQEASNTINHRDNIGSTSRPINQSKNGHDLREWEEKTASGKTCNNQERFEIDKELSEKKYKESKEHLSREINKKASSKIISDIKNTAPSQLKSSVGHGVKIAMAKLLKELLKSLIKEFRNNKNSSEAFSIRIKRVFDDVMSKLKDVLKVFGKSTFNSFVSELINTIVNFFQTTSKRVFKIIRATFTSIVNAFKIILSSDNKYTFEEKAYEALKLISASITLSVGIILEELIEKAIINLMPFLAPYASTISVILASFLTGVATIFVLRAWDTYKEKFIFKTKDKIFELENKSMFINSQLSNNEILKSSVASINTNNNTFLSKKMFSDSLPIFNSLKNEIDITYDSTRIKKNIINQQSQETKEALYGTQNLLNELDLI